MLAFFMQRQVVGGPALALFSDDGPARGAAVVLPARSRKEATDG
jgi:hypothetical protein